METDDCINQQIIEKSGIKENNKLHAIKYIKKEEGGDINCSFLLKWGYKIVSGLNSYLKNEELKEVVFFLR